MNIPARPVAGNAIWHSQAHEAIPTGKREMWCSMTDQESARQQDGEYMYEDQGISLRDYFATAAMNAFISGAIASGAQSIARASTVVASYEMADAMLEARKG